MLGVGYFQGVESASFGSDKCSLTEKAENLFFSLIVVLLACKDGEVFAFGGGQLQFTDSHVKASQLICELSLRDVLLAYYVTKGMCGQGEIGHHFSTHFDIRSLS